MNKKQLRTLLLIIWGIVFSGLVLCGQILTYDYSQYATTVWLIALLISIIGGIFFLSSKDYRRKGE
jgi:uncharacterized membrane protein